MSFYSLTFLGVSPIGSLIAGIVAARFHATVTVAIGGALCVAGALYCARSETRSSEEAVGAAPG